MKPIEPDIIELNPDHDALRSFYEDSLAEAWRIETAMDELSPTT